VNGNDPLCAACLVVLVGPPRSGKSTWAHRNGYSAVHVSQDDLIDATTPAGFGRQRWLRIAREAGCPAVAG
jgi:adenylate kinase family enzyme